MNEKKPVMPVAFKASGKRGPIMGIEFRARKECCNSNNESKPKPERSPYLFQW